MLFPTQSVYLLWMVHCRAAVVHVLHMFMWIMKQHNCTLMTGNTIFSTVHLNATSQTALSPSKRRITCVVVSCLSPLGCSVKCQRLRFRGTSSSKCPSVYFLYLRSNVPPLILWFLFFSNQNDYVQVVPGTKNVEQTLSQETCEHAAAEQRGTKLLHQQISS